VTEKPEEARAAEKTSEQDTDIEKMSRSEVKAELERRGIDTTQATKRVLEAVEVTKRAAQKIGSTEKTPEQAAQEVIDRRKAAPRVELPRDPDEIRRLLAQRRKAMEAARRPVTVSISERGRIRRNGPCPCGSQIKFKKCCLPRVRSGELVRLPKQKRPR
jgi:uncharacterized protein YecA (UPF0149 family)